MELRLEPHRTYSTHHVFQRKFPEFIPDFLAPPLQSLEGLRFKSLLCRWRRFSQEADGRDRPVDDIAREVHGHYETAIRRDPANWFWVHRRWKAPSTRQADSAVAGPRGA